MISSTRRRAPRAPRPRGRAATLLFASFASFASFAAAPRAAEPTAPGGAPALDGFVVPDGLAVTLVAESPLLYNPTAMDVDAQGRLWVTEAVNYRQWNGRNPGRHHEQGDRVVVLSDTDDDGVFDSSHVFVQDPELTAPLGIAVIGSAVYVSCSPNLFVYHDDDGDLVPDRRETLLTGFGGPDHDHGLHSVSFGPDGRLLFNAGNAGPHIVTDADGFALRSGSMYRGGGEVWADNQPGLVSADGRVWTGGLVMRADTDGGRLQVLAHNFRNPYEVAADSFGDLWQTDNDDDGNQGCRASWILEGGDYGYFSPDGSRGWQTDRRPGQETWRAHWHADDPGVCPPGAITGSGGPTGVCVSEGSLMPRLRGKVLGADAGRSRVFLFTPLAEGAGYGLQVDTLIRSVPGGTHGDRPQLFRPSDVCVDVDGSILVADWFDPGVGGHLAGDAQAYGRILRIAPAGHVRRVPVVDPRGRGGALFALASPAPSVRALGWKALREAGAAAADALSGLLEQPDPILRARAAWLLARLPDGRERLAPLAASSNPRLRVVRARALASRWDATGAPLDEVAELLGELSTDPSPLVRRVAAELCQRRGVPEAAPDTLPELAARLAADDRWMLEAIGNAVELIGPDAATLVAAAPDRHAAERLLWRLHPEDAVPYWRALALGRPAARPVDETTTPAPSYAALCEGREGWADDEPPTPARSEQAVSTLAFTPGRAAAEALLEVALAGDGRAAELAAFWVRHHDDHVWPGYGLAGHLANEWDARTLAWSSGVVRGGRHPVELDVTGATRAALIATDAGDGNSCDWIDWLAPHVDGPRGRTCLAHGCATSGRLAWSSAESGWGDVNRGASCAGGPLAVDGAGFTDGIGAHAPSVIVFDLPEGAERLSVVAACDDGGTGQGDPSPTSVVFEVHVLRPESHAELLAWQALVDDGEAELAAREEAAEALARHPSGGAWLVDRAASRALDERLRPVVAAAIWDNPDLGLRALASEHFARPGARAALPPVSALLALDGDPARGRALFASADAACSTCHAFDGRGGDVGPELTRIREKYDAPALLDAILNPSAAIGFGYDPWAFRLTDGRVLTGLVQADGARVVLKDGLGERHVLEADTIAERWRLTRSLMPDDAALGLDAQGLADLSAFLLEDRARPPRLGEPVDLLAGGLDGWVGVFRDDDARAADVFRWDGATLSTAGQPVGYVRTQAAFTSYELLVEWRFPPGSPPGNSGVLLRVHGPEQVWPRSIEAQLHGGDAGDIWNIGAFDLLVDAGRTSGRRTVKRAPSSERPPGQWNRYRIVLDGPDLALYVNDVLQNTARWCEERPGHIALQSEGAPIEFRKVELRPILR